MQILENDIIVKNCEGRKVIWLHSELIRGWLKLSEVYLRKVRSVYKDSVQKCHHGKTWLPDTGLAWRWGKKDGEIYFCYDNIPNKAPTNYKDQLPSINEMFHMEHLAKGNGDFKTPLNQFLKEFIAENKDSYNRHYAQYTERQQQQLSMAAAGLAGTVAYIKAAGIDHNKLAFYQHAATELQNIGATYLPSYYRNLKNKVTALLNGQPINELVHLKREGNTNALTHGSDADIEAWV